MENVWIMVMFLGWHGTNWFVEASVPASKMRRNFSTENIIDQCIKKSAL